MRYLDTRQICAEANVLFEDTDPDYVVDVNTAGTMLWQAEVPVQLLPVKLDVLNAIRALSQLCDEAAGIPLDEGLRLASHADQTLGKFPGAKKYYDAYKELID